MSRFSITLAVALGLSAPAFAQGAADAAKQAVTQAATQAVTDSIHKATGVDDTKAGKDKKAKKDKDGPNWGKSEDHRQDGEHGHKGKKKN